VIGSYEPPQTPICILTIQRQPDDPPPGDIHIKVTPPDAGGVADAFLNAGAPMHWRYYGQGADVTLRAPELPDYEFCRWQVGTEFLNSPPPCVGPRQVTINIYDDLLAIPRYVPIQP
jgi:hypothetical protein